MAKTEHLNSEQEYREHYRALSVAKVILKSCGPCTRPKVSTIFWRVPSSDYQKDETPELDTYKSFTKRQDNVYVR